MSRLLAVSIITTVIACASGFALARLRAPARAVSFDAADASATWKSKCAKCHGSDGRGKTFRGKLVHARDLTGADWQSDVSDERIYNSISNGKGKMPSFKKELTDSQIDELVGYVRHFRK